MKILGIETSCDETAASVVQDGTKILSNVVASSAWLHAKTGGMIPENAARQQILSIIPVINEAINGFSKKEIDAISVNAGGPGLIGSMLVGVETAKTLAYLWKKPIVPAVHILSHLYANWLTPNNSPQFPALVLTVAGGHSDLILMKNHGKFEWIGGTRDDAAGECFDKCARILGLGYPGGPAIAVEAAKFEARNPKFELRMFPRPMMKNFSGKAGPGYAWDFSFSGLKTSVARQSTNEQIKKLGIPRIAAEIQEAIVSVLVEKTIKAVNKFKPESLLLAGGVAANSRLRELFKLRIENCKLKINFFVPPPQLCTDNATYVASYAYFNFHPVDWQKIKAIPDAFEAIEVYANSKSQS
ncbi:MAG: tRNA (adenosine(37)-N6)-threonylcarbamoyltransferase complex transferase subunit TsaD [Patescibacteria group bacterium]